MSNNTFVLYAKPSFLEGMARLVDFTGSLNQYNISPSPEEADAKALLSDWEAVGNDIWFAHKKFIQETRGETSDEPQATKQPSKKRLTVKSKK